MTVTENRYMIKAVKRDKHKKNLEKVVINMAQTNVELVTAAAEIAGIEYNGENLKTFAEWKRVGMSVKKGEKASVTVSLWKPVTKEEENKETGKKEMKKTFIKKLCHLFTPDQVQPVKEKAAKKEAAAPTEKKEAAKKEVTKKKTSTQRKVEKTVKKAAASVKKAKAAKTTKELLNAARAGVRVAAPETVEEVKTDRVFTSEKDAVWNADIKGSEKVAVFYKVSDLLFHESDLARAEHHAMGRVDITKVVAIIAADYFIGTWQVAENIPGYKVIYTELVEAAYITDAELDENQLTLF